MDILIVTQYIDARITELTRLRDTFEKTDRHYYALSAGIYELLMLHQHMSTKH